MFIYVMAIIVAAAVLIVGRSVVRTLSAKPSDDPLIHDILVVLPGANCGACGNASCHDAAVSVARGRQPATLCTTGGIVTAAAVTAVLRKHTFDQVG